MLIFYYGHGLINCCHGRVLILMLLPEHCPANDLNSTVVCNASYWFISLFSIIVNKRVSSCRAWQSHITEKQLTVTMTPARQCVCPSRLLETDVHLQCRPEVMPELDPTPSRDFFNMTYCHHQFTETNILNWMALSWKHKITYHSIYNSHDKYPYWILVWPCFFNFKH